MNANVPAPNQAESASARAIKREMARRANDEIRIQNPTDKSFFVQWDGYKWEVPAKGKDVGFGEGMRVVPRYIAMHYIKHMTDKLITEESHKILEKAKKNYKGNHWPDEEERLAIRTNDEDQRRKWFSQLYVKLERRYGGDVEPAGDEAFKPRDQRSMEQILMEEAEAQLNDVVDLDELKKDLEDEVS